MGVCSLLHLPGKLILTADTNCIKAIGEESKQRTKIETPKKSDSIKTTIVKIVLL